MNTAEAIDYFSKPLSLSRVPTKAQTKTKATTLSLCKAPMGMETCRNESRAESHDKNSLQDAASEPEKSAKDSQLVYDFSGIAG